MWLRWRWSDGRRDYTYCILAKSMCDWGKLAWGRTGRHWWVVIARIDAVVFVECVTYFTKIYHIFGKNFYAHHRHLRRRHYVLGLSVREYIRACIQNSMLAQYLNAGESYLTICSISANWGFGPPNLPFPCAGRRPCLIRCYMEPHVFPCQWRLISNLVISLM